MKVALLAGILILLVSSCTNSGNEKVVYDNEYNNVVALAENSDQNIIIDFYTVWCGGCIAYDRYIFSNKEVLDSLKNKFLVVKINAEKKENLDLKDKYKVNSYPQIILTDSKGDELGRISGYKGVYTKNPSKFIADVNKILEGKNTLKSLVSKIKQNPENIDLIEKLINSYINLKKYEGVKKLSLQMMSKTKEGLARSKAKFFYAYAELKLNSNPKELIAISQDTSDIHKNVKVWALDNLKKHFEDPEKKSYYYQRIVDIKPEDIYTKSRYAEFLYKNDLDLKKAVKLTDEFIQVARENDHWKPYLFAYKEAIKGNIIKGLQNYDEWLNKYEKIWQTSDLYWAYIHYAEVALQYEKDLSGALEYAEKAEAYGGMWYDKKLTGSLLFKQKKFERAVIKFEEAKQLASRPEQIQELTGLIDKCR